MRAPAIPAVALTLLALLPLACAAPAAAQQFDEDRLPTLSVTGSSQLSVQPDELRLRLAVVTEADSAESALRENSQRAQRVMDALSRAGIERDDMETTGFSVSPRYNYNRRDGEPPEIVGYTVSNEVMVTTRDLELAGPLIEEGVKAGANRVSSIAFGLADPRKHRAEAIADATAKARADAEALATAAGVRLVRILSIDLDPDSSVSPMRFAGERAMAADASIAPPIEPGEVDVTARVSITWEVADRDGRGADAGAVEPDREPLWWLSPELRERLIDRYAALGVDPGYGRQPMYAPEDSAVAPLPYWTPNTPPAWRGQGDAGDDLTRFALPRDFGDGGSGGGGGSSGGLDQPARDDAGGGGGTGGGPSDSRSSLDIEFRSPAFDTETTWTIAGDAIESRGVLEVHRDRYGDLRYQWWPLRKASTRPVRAMPGSVTVSTAGG